ncbi:MAG: O-methyltransferase [Arachnia sp.]
MSKQSSNTGAPNAQSWGYTEDFVPADELMREAREEALLAGFEPISTGVAAALTALTAAKGAATAVEVGTLMGASALALLRGMGDKGVVTSIDAEVDQQICARSVLTRAGYSSSRFRLIAGRPLEVLPKLRDAAYDVVLVNGDKLEYVECVAEASRLLRPGGLLLVHDALWHGAVADPEDEGDEAIIIREALEAVTRSEAYAEALLPVGDGLLLAVKLPR